MLLIFIVSIHRILKIRKDKERITISNAFQKILKEPNPKPNKIWVDKGSEFYNRSMRL